MASLKADQSFIQKVLLQQEANRLVHDNPEEDDIRQPLDWGVIVAEHTGHLLGALRENNVQLIETEIFHIAAPLLELYNSLITQTVKLLKYKCLSCGQILDKLTETKDKCPLCEGKLERVEI